MVVSRYLHVFEHYLMLCAICKSLLSRGRLEGVAKKLCVFIFMDMWLWENLIFFEDSSRRCEEFPRVFWSGKETRWFDMSGTCL